MRCYFLSTRMVFSNKTFEVSVENNMFMHGQRIGAFVCSLVSATVFANPKLKKSVYKFFLIQSIADALYSFSLITIAPFYDLCSSQSRQFDQHDTELKICYFYMFYAVFMSAFLTTCLSFFSIIDEIYLTLQRIYLVSNERSVLIKKGANPYLVCLILLPLTLFAHTPVLFLSNINTVEYQLGNRTASVLVFHKTKFAESTEAVVIINLLNAVRMILVHVILLVVNIIAIIKSTG